MKLKFEYTHIYTVQSEWQILHTIWLIVGVNSEHGICVYSVYTVQVPIQSKVTYEWDKWNERLSHIGMNGKRLEAQRFVSMFIYFLVSWKIYEIYHISWMHTKQIQTVEFLKLFRVFYYHVKNVEYFTIQFEYWHTI